jgi:hypothetical protein
VAHHGDSVIHNHPTSPTIPDDKDKWQNAELCPAVKSMAKNDPVENEVCPIVGPVSAYLPPSHPNLTEKEAGKICPVTVSAVVFSRVKAARLTKCQNAKLEHHEGKVHNHPSVPADAPAQKCPVAGSMIGKQAA